MQFVKLFLWALGALVMFLGPAIAQGQIDLRTHCPPGFENVDGHCELRSLYQLYGSLEGQGVGGLKTGLPPIREGFSPQQIDLGRYLFFDPILSKDGTVSCATCHDPDQGFTDGLGRSIGVTGDPVGRSAPTLWNVGFLTKLFWDARAATLEEQMLGPLYDAHEMGSTREGLDRRLNDNAAYQRLFAEAFERDEASGILLDELYLALTAFEASLISLNSRYDHYAHGSARALNADEIAGLNVFRSFVARCAECHTPPLFTNQQIAVIGTPEPEGLARDVGAAKPFEDETMRGGFRVPSLRNIELTAPYMHSGRFPTLEEAAAFYTKGRGHAVPKGEDLKIHWHIWEPDLTDQEVQQIAAFLRTLTDESFKPDVPARVPSGLPIGGEK